MTKLLKNITFAAVCALCSLSAGALELEDFVLSQSRPKGAGEFTPAADGRYFYRLEDNSVNRYSYRRDEKAVTIYDGQGKTEWDDYRMEAGDRLVVLWTGKREIYRHSFSADHYIYDTRSGRLDKLSEAGGEEIVTVSGDGARVAWVKDNDIYLKELATGSVTRVTTDGRKNEVINGVPDWVYQEEFGMLNSLRFSPDGLKLAFLRWDESRVPMCSMQMYRGDCEPRAENAAHPESYDYKYPCAGERNATVTAHCYDITTGITREATPNDGAEYIPSLEFTPGGALMVTTLNRAQTHLRIYPVDNRGVAAACYDELSDIWIDDASELAHYYDDFFVVMSNRDGYRHLYQYSYDGTLKRQLTAGEYEVTDYYGYDETKQLFYVQTTNGPLDRTVRSVDTRGLTRVITPGSGTYTATFNSDFSLYIRSFSDAVTPPQYSIYTAAGKKLRDLEMNKAYRDTYTSPEVPTREFFTLDNAGYTLNGYMVKPVDFDPEKKYPVILSQYSGPGSQEVRNNWKMGWEQYYATQGFVIVCVDPRGTGARGKEFLRPAYLNMGLHETDDQVAVAAHMASLPWVDAQHIGMYGWSYGGFETLMAMSRPDNHIAAGVSIAPVTSWRFYDSIYTERFMLTPQENATGYDRSPLGEVEKLHGELLLMFGSADDNVRIVNSMEYLSRLVSLNRSPQLMVFPNMNHSINGCEARLTVYSRMLDFFNSTLK